MAGHNKWSKIKHIKEVVDAKRGKIFSKLAREITVATRDGGGDINFNASLRQAVDNAKAQNMPKENIERAIKKGTGDLQGSSFEECIFEGFAPGGIGFIAITLTDNKNRTSAEIRKIFSKNNASLGKLGSVTYLFDRLGEITIAKDTIKEDKLLEIAIESGAQNMFPEEDFYIIHTESTQLNEVATNLSAKNIKLNSQNLIYYPQNFIDINDPEQAEKLINFYNILEDYDDTQNVFTNFNIIN